jgi:hypothetical protein
MHILKKKPFPKTQILSKIKKIKFMKKLFKSVIWVKKDGKFNLTLDEQSFHFGGKFARILVFT